MRTSNIIRYPNPATTLSTDAGQNFTPGGTRAGYSAGFGRFGRIIGPLWKDDSSSMLLNAGYGYNQASNRIWREDVPATAKNATQDIRCAEQSDPEF